MAEEEKVIDAEIEKSEEQPAEKKENGFTKFWNKTKKSVNDSILEAKIRSNYEKSHDSFTVYQKDNILSTTVYGELNGDELKFFGKEDIKPNSVVVDDKTEKAYYVLASFDATVESVVDKVVYEREGTILALDGKVTEVNVIKAGKRYFLYKG